jgi:hypothetical protein
MVSVTPRPHSTPGKDLVPIVQESGWAPGPVWTSAKNLASTGIRSPDRTTRSQSLYWLSYPAHSLHYISYIILYKHKEDITPKYCTHTHARTQDPAQLLVVNMALHLPNGVSTRPKRSGQLKASYSGTIASLFVSRPHDSHHMLSWRPHRHRQLHSDGWLLVIGTSNFLAPSVTAVTKSS